MKLSFPLLLSLALMPLVDLQSQWQRQYPLEKLEDVLDIDISSDGYGFAAGTNDLLMRMDPITRKWDLLLGFDEGWQFESVDYFDGSGGMIVAAAGQGLILSMDAGNNWTEITGGPTSIHTIKMFSPTHMMAISDEGAYEWKDGTWTDLAVPAVVGIKGGFILDEQRMWAFTFATGPAIYYTTDGGDTWNTNTDIEDIDVVTFYDAANGIASDGRKIYNTTNGGVNWTLISNNAIHNTSNDITFGSSLNVLMAATLNADPALSTDGGVTWTQLMTDLINQRSYSVASFSDDEFVVGNDLSGMAYTTDRGTTWVETSGPTRNVVQDIHFLTRALGFAVGQKGMLLRTFDGGTNWEDISFGTRSHFTIHGLTPNDIWIGTNQRILHSVDTGITWTEKLVIASSNFNDVLALSSQKILAAATSGVIYRSNDAGTTWDTVYNAGSQIRSIAQIDDNRLMATAFNGILLRSEDMGETWHPVTVPEAGLQYEQSFFVDSVGWLITSSFKSTMWKTTDAGDSWTPVALPIDRFWDGVYFISPDTGIVVARSTQEGRAYITFSGGQSWTAGYITDFPLHGVSGFPHPNGTAWIYGYGSDIEVLPYCNTYPVISNFAGDLFPCEGEVVTYSITSENVDNFSWFFPPGWQVLANANNDTVQVIAGSNSGVLTVYGSNPCGNSGQIVHSAGPDLLPSVFNIVGNLTPCAGEVVTYSSITLEVDTFHWQFPADWQILGDPNEPVVEVLVGNESGLITITGSNFCGSEQLSFDTDPFTPPNVGIIQLSQGILSLSASGIQYQWFHNGTPIPGATNATYQVEETGLYYALITFIGGCSTVSNEVLVTITAVINPSALALDVYPIPAIDKLFLKGIEGEFEYSISGITGQTLLQGSGNENVVPVHSLTKGIYFLQVLHKDLRYEAKFTIQ